MRISTPAFVALAAGLAAAGFAFVSSPAGADDKTNAEPAKRLSTAVFAGGCFWCTEADFDKVDGVYDTVSGYIGGDVANPSYKQVVRGGTGHYEAVKVSYNADEVSYEELLDYFFRTIDPVDAKGQFCDKGASYRSAVFAGNADEISAAQAEIAEINESGVLPKPVVTQIVETSTFWPAEDYHQDYYKKNPIRYKFYRNGCGRDARLKKLWGESPSG